MPPSLRPDSPSDPLPDPPTDLGAFSVSLAVADLAASRDFYRALGFERVGGDGETWQMLRCGEATIGLFQGLFDRNILTFNPVDVRAVQAAAVAAGLEPVERAAEGDGPAHVTLVDPDGNPLLFDQHDAGPGSEWRDADIARIRALVAHLEARLEALGAH